MLIDDWHEVQQCSGSEKPENRPQNESPEQKFPLRISQVGIGNACILVGKRVFLTLWPIICDLVHNSTLLKRFLDHAVPAFGGCQSGYTMQLRSPEATDAGHLFMVGTA